MEAITIYRGTEKSLARPDSKKKKKKLKFRHFSSDAEVIAATETWLDGQSSEFFFFESLAKVKSLVAVACFLPGRAKDLSALRYKQFPGYVMCDFSTVPAGNLEN